MGRRASTEYILLPSELQALYWDLGSWRPSVRQRAMAQAATLSPEALGILAAKTATQKSRMDKKCRRELSFACKALVVSFSVLLVIFPISWYLGYVTGMIFLLILLASLVVIVDHTARIATTSVRRQLHSLLSVLEQRAMQEDLPAILHCLSVSSGVSSRKSRRPLWERLPDYLAAISPEIAETWAEGQCTVLRQSLVAVQFRSAPIGSSSEAGHHRIALATLRLIDRFGNEEDLRTLQRLAALTGPSELWEAVRECLPRLKAAIEAKRHPTMLLRPSEAPVQPETLLRPAAKGADTPVEQLLRPGP